MKQWHQFNHRDVYPYLKAIVEQVRPMGAEVSSCGEGKITLQWPEGELVYLRRFREGPYRWLLFTEANCQSLTLANRDPSILELQTALQVTEILIS